MTNDDILQREPASLIAQAISKATAVPMSELGLETGLRELGFDSLKHFQLMLEVERILGREFTEDEVDTVLACTTLGEICAEVEKLADGPACTAPAPQGEGDQRQESVSEARDFAKLIALSNECWVSRALHTAVLLRIADCLADGSLEITQLARRTGAEPAKLAAIIEVLSHRGIFTLDANRVGQTPASSLLHSEHPQGVCNIIEWMGSDEVWAALGNMPKAMAGEKTAFETANGAGLFAYLAENPDRSAVFDRHMTGYTSRQASAILSHCDLAGFASIADIGSGDGLLANAIAAQNTAAHVTAFDLPGCSFSALEETSRVSKIHGDIFTDPLPKAELSILCNVLHDWPDDEAAAILSRLAENASPGARLYVIEGLPEDREAKVAMVNLGMTVTTGGRQRSYGEYAALLAKAGYEIDTTEKCSDYLSIIKARRC